MKKIITIIIQICIVFSTGILGGDWYVRPVGGNYGSENGTSYANAWDGLLNVRWGAGGVQPGDTLYICGLHYYNRTNRYQGSGDITISVSGTSQNRITIRGDYPGDPGIIWGAHRMSYDGGWTYEGDNTYSNTMGSGTVDWHYQDVTVSSWVVLDIAEGIAECKANAGSCYWDSVSHKLYVHCTDGGDPTDRIFSSMNGHRFLISGTEYITLLNLKFYDTYRIVYGEPGGYSNIRFENCVFWYAASYGDPLNYHSSNYHHIEVVGCDIAWGVGGVNFDGGAGIFTISRNLIHDIGVRESTWNSDAHGISAQKPFDSVIENNEVYNCGTGITFYNGELGTCTNNIIRWNYIHDTHTLGGANSRGIEHNATINDVDTSGNEAYGNIVVNCEDVGYRFRYKDLGKFYNNIAYNCGTSFYLHRQGGTTYGLKVELKNNISMNPTLYHIYFQDSDHQPGTGDINCRLDSDHNIFYPISGNQFVFNHAGSATTTNFVGWQALQGESRPGSTFDPHSLTSDPLFVNGSGNYSLDTDFKIPSNSPAKDAGIGVGLAEDYFGNFVPRGSGYDIGIHEYNPTSKIELRYHQIK